MTQCRHCYGEIDERATACPHCGKSPCPASDEWRLGTAIMALGLVSALPAFIFDPLWGILCLGVAGLGVIVRRM